jgi:uncharacterized membrane protein YjfL (UPF0719 family)
MNPDIILTGLVMIAAFFVLFLIGKVVNDVIHKEYKLTFELVQRDNPALALAVVGYYFGLVLSIGGAMVGPSRGIINDLLSVFGYGLLAIVLLNISWFVCDKIILHQFRISDELIRDQNVGTGAVSAGVSIASGFIIYGSVQGESGGVLTTIVFWILGQIIMILAGWIYEWITPYKVHDEIEKDNVPAGVSFGGALVAVGTVIGLAAESDFVSWSESLPGYIGYAVIGLVLLPVIRFLADKILLPTVKLSDEIAAQEKPNLGAAFIEAFSYIAAAYIIYWCV